MSPAIQGEQGRSTCSLYDRPSASYFHSVTSKEAPSRGRIFLIQRPGTVGTICRAYSQAVPTVSVTGSWEPFGKYLTVHGSEAVLGLLALPVLHP
jgi:hypothetical protein